jgi:glycosyltransferase involved in cell wall biosynthesis
VRAANIASALARSHHLTILSADGREQTVPGWPEASDRFMNRRRSPRALALDAVEGIAKGRHVLQIRSVRAGMPEVVETWLGSARPELVVLGRPLLAPYIKLARSAGARVVIDADESLAKVAWSVARSPEIPWRKRSRFLIEAITILGRMERESYRDADQLWASSGEEKRGLSEIINPSRIFVVPNAVAIPSSPPGPSIVRAVSFLGWYGYPPNEAAALELMRSIMPAIRLAGGPTQLVLIGSEPTPMMARVAAAMPDVTITGRVPDVISPLLAAGVLVVPLRAGGGTRIKILEAAAAGVPVISTRLGIEGLNMVPDRDVLTAETPSEFAVQVGRISADPALRARLVRSAYELVRERNSLTAVQASIKLALTDLDGVSSL